MLILIYLPLVLLSHVVELQLRGKPLAGFIFDRPEYFAKHLIRIHAAVAAFCVVQLVLVFLTS